MLRSQQMARLNKGCLGCDLQSIPLIRYGIGGGSELHGLIAQSSISIPLQIGSRLPLALGFQHQLERRLEYHLWDDDNEALAEALSTAG